MIELPNALIEVLHSVVFQQGVQHCLGLVLAHATDDVTSYQGDALSPDELIEAGHDEIGVGCHRVLLEIFQVGKDLIVLGSYRLRKTSTGSSSAA